MSRFAGTDFTFIKMSGQCLSISGQNGVGMLDRATAPRVINAGRMSAPYFIIVAFRNVLLSLSLIVM
jgi:hypothetical protein